MRLQGIRAVPSLTYLERTPRFVIRPDSALDPENRGLKKAARPQVDPSLESHEVGGRPFLRVAWIGTGVR